MDCQIMICSADELFANMIKLEFELLGKSVVCAAQPPESFFADVLILDLDSVSPPSRDCYRRMIGFTRLSSAVAYDVRSLCSMVFHRPFEIRLLRREVLGEALAEYSAKAPLLRKKTPVKPVLQKERSELHVSGASVHLSPRELILVERLLESRGNAVDRQELSRLIGESSANKVDVYICYLRRKFEAAFGEALIKTQRGKGYRME